MNEKEILFLEEFKKVMIEGFWMWKKSRLYGYAYRRFYIDPDHYQFCYDSRVRGKRSKFHYSDIIKIYSVRDEREKKSFRIDLMGGDDRFWGNHESFVRTMELKCLDQESAELMKDGFLLLTKEYKLLTKRRGKGEIKRGEIKREDDLRIL